MTEEIDDDFLIAFEGAESLKDETKEEREGRYAEGRRVNRTYVSKGFEIAPGVNARFVTKVFSEDESEVAPYADGEVWLVRESPKGRAQVKLLVAGEPGRISKLWIQRITHRGGVARAESFLSLDAPEAARLTELIRNLEYIPSTGEAGIRVDDALVRELFKSPESVTQLYERDRDAFRRLITDDAAARDVVALQRRRAEVDRFRRLLNDEDYFDAEVERSSGRSEEVWQEFFENNPWILGTGLGGQLYTSWDEARLEQVVAGSSIAREGKRADALMRTSGVVRWMTFAEFKTHRTRLVDNKEYRPGAWRVSAEVAGGVAQAQATVRRAIEDIGEVLRSKAADGAEIPGDMTFLTRPRSFLVAGQLTELLGEDGGPHREKIRSFELFRRGLTDPEIVTFDELLARAEWVVDVEES
jgi:hypothetical protein